MPSWELETENLEISLRGQYQLVGPARSRRSRGEGGGGRRGREERPAVSGRRQILCGRQEAAE